MSLSGDEGRRNIISSILSRAREPRPENRAGVSGPSIQLRLVSPLFILSLLKMAIGKIILTERGTLICRRHDPIRYFNMR